MSIASKDSFARNALEVNFANLGNHKGYRQNYQVQLASCQHQTPEVGNPMTNDTVPSENAKRSGTRIFWSSLIWTIGWAIVFGAMASQNPSDFFNLPVLNILGYTVDDAIAEMLIYFVPITFLAFTLGNMFVHWVLNLKGFTASIAMLICTFGTSLMANSILNPWF